MGVIDKTLPGRILVSNTAQLSGEEHCNVGALHCARTLEGDSLLDKTIFPLGVSFKN